MDRGELLKIGSHWVFTVSGNGGRAVQEVTVSAASLTSDKSNIDATFYKNNDGSLGVITEDRYSGESMDAGLGDIEVLKSVVELLHGNSINKRLVEIEPPY